LLTKKSWKVPKVMKWCSYHLVHILKNVHLMSFGIERFKRLEHARNGELNHSYIKKVPLTKRPMVLFFKSLKGHIFLFNVNNIWSPQGCGHNPTSQKKHWIAKKKSKLNKNLCFVIKAMAIMTSYYFFLDVNVKEFKPKIHLMKILI